MSVVPGEPRRRLRELGIAIGRFEPGPFNAITDVEGVRVGHTTLHTGSGPLVVGEGPVRTGVTAILPNEGTVFNERLIAGTFVLNGAGELAGLTQLNEWGLLETPILLTNTLSVGAASQGMIEHLLERFPSIGVEHDVIIPVVGECDDSFLNDIGGGHVTAEHARRALESATGGPVEEGCVGGGTGMVCFDLKGGIGTSSRVLPEELGGFRLGVLVMTNFGRIADLRVDGVPVGEELASYFAREEKRPNLYGSIIAVLATDAPLSTSQLNRVCKRVSLGLGRMGSYAAHGSGEIIVGFSTANTVPRGKARRIHRLHMLADWAIDPLYQAAIECAEEAVLNALCMAVPTDGADGRHVRALPLAAVTELWQRHRGRLGRPIKSLRS
ncbi:MAG: P1 family peptidase [Myxococcales bacterium]|nr:P1 family peptidase [Myxococcales bacterium]MCB9732776.1 P1 family peptidase [Deltaproteobacteria bacterium]